MYDCIYSYLELLIECLDGRVYGAPLYDGLYSPLLHAGQSPPLCLSVYISLSLSLQDKRLMSVCSKPFLPNQPGCLSPDTNIFMEAV